MKCPKCGYDMMGEYEEILYYEEAESPYVKITNMRPSNTLEVMGGLEWDVELICSRCKTRWVTSDSNW